VASETHHHFDGPVRHGYCYDDVMARKSDPDCFESRLHGTKMKPIHVHIRSKHFDGCKRPPDWSYIDVGSVLCVPFTRMFLIRCGYDVDLYIKRTLLMQLSSDDKFNFLNLLS
jgi:hypothetical protein